MFRDFLWICGRSSLVVSPLVLYSVQPSHAADLQDQSPQRSLSVPADEIFDNPSHVVGENYFMEETGEQRFQIIGMTRKLLLLVVFVEAGSDVIRIVWARKAVDYEESIYQDQFR